MRCNAAAAAAAAPQGCREVARKKKSGILDVSDVSDVSGIFRRFRPFFEFCGRFQTKLRGNYAAYATTNAYATIK